MDEIEKLSEQIDMLKKKAFDLDSQKAMHETTIQVEDVKNSELRNEMYQLDREVNKLQEQYAKLSEESRMLETRMKNESMRWSLRAMPKKPKS